MGKTVYIGIGVRMGVKIGISQITFIGALAIGMAAAGCASMGPPKDAEPSPEILPASTNRATGSLWTPGSSRTYLFQDTKARNVGDTVTVQIVENAKGSKDAQTKSGRSSTIDASTTAFLGISDNILDKIKANANFSDDFDGSGSTTRSGTLTAVVTAVVMAVQPNGNLVVDGRREVLINGEKEYIMLTGVIRPEDIGPSNTVLSTQVADAKIEYTGWGVINDKQHPGWLIRILDWIWPF